MEDREADISGQLAPWQDGAAFNTYYTYSFVGHAAFFSMVGPGYYDFMNRWIRQWLYWYDGWVPWWHNQGNGIMSTRLAGALVDKVAKKVVGGRVMYKNAGKEQQTSQNPNKALQYISGKWAKETDFSNVVKLATKYAAAAGTSIIKLNKDDKGLWAEALRFDSFLPTVGVRGEVLEIKCFLQSFVDMDDSKKEGNKAASLFYVVEQRYFGEFRRANGKIIPNAPLAKYIVKRNSGNVTNGAYLSGDMGEFVEFSSLPKDVRKNIKKSYGALRFDEPILLPFVDSLGVELVKWTDGIGNLPAMPFGESFLSNIIAALMAYDYYFSAFTTDLYTGRAHVIMPATMNSAKAADGSNYNAGFDSYMYHKVSYMNGEDQKPVPLQFDLRSKSWLEIRDMLIQYIALNTGLNISTIASFMQDNNSAKTAREVSTEENETAGVVDDKRELLERPINRILKLVTDYAGYPDTVVIRWSGAGLTNRYTLSEILATALQGGFISRLKAVQMFNFDDDDAQVDEEYKRILEQDGNAANDEQDYFGDGGGTVNEEPRRQFPQ